MKVNIDNTFLFLKGNKNKLIVNPPDNSFNGDYTILTEFTPDFEYIKNNCQDGGWHTMGLLCKNGKHMGLFFTAGRDQEGEMLYKVSFEWWHHTDDPEVDQVKSIDHYVTEEDIQKPIQVVVEKKKDALTFTVNEKHSVTPIQNVVDYSYSYTWLGCANRLSPDFQHIYEGELHKLHFQEGTVTSEETRQFFSSFPRFVHKVGRDKGRKVLFTSDFEEVALYKVKDLSYNNNHLIKYSDEWLG